MFERPPSNSAPRPCSDMQYAVFDKKAKNHDKTALVIF